MSPWLRQIRAMMRTRSISSWQNPQKTESLHFGTARRFHTFRRLKLIIVPRFRRCNLHSESTAERETTSLLATIFAVYDATPFRVRCFTAIAPNVTSVEPFLTFTVNFPHSTNVPQLKSTAIIPAMMEFSPLLP